MCVCVCVCVIMCVCVCLCVRVIQDLEGFPLFKPILLSNVICDGDSSERNSVRVVEDAGIRLDCHLPRALLSPMPEV